MVNRYTGRGEFLGGKPTGREVALGGDGLPKEGKIVEGWDSYDGLGVLRQPGAMPA